MLKRSLSTAVPALACLLLVSCGSGNTSGLNLFITDAPIDSASAVNISFSQLQLTGPNASPQTLTVNPPTTVDLYQLQGGIAAYVTSGWQIKPGRYTQLSVTIATDPFNAQSYITLPDGTHILYIPSGVSPTVNIPIDFTYTDGATVNLTMDFDLRRSIIQDPNDPTKYELIPSLRAIENEFSGTITGSIASNIVICNQPAVYIYRGIVTPTDIDIDASPGTVQPITTELAGYNITTGMYNYTAGYLPPGTYTVAYTCEATVDVANQVNNISFPAVGTGVVTAQNTTFVDLK